MFKNIELPLYSLISPILAWTAFLAAGNTDARWLIAVVGLMLIAAVLSAVHHAEVVAHKVGEPFGTIILALAVTVIETGLIITLMINAQSDGEVIATIVLLPEACSNPCRTL